MSRNENLFVVLAAAVPILAFKMGILLIQYKRKQRKASRIFRKELIRGGLPRDRANELAVAYAESIGIRKMLRQMGGLGGSTRFLQTG